MLKKKKKKEEAQWKPQCLIFFSCMVPSPPANPLPISAPAKGVISKSWEHLFHSPLSSEARLTSHYADMHQRAF